MEDIKQASIYMRVLWYNDNENLRPETLNIKLDGENTEEVIFSISQNNNNAGNNASWEANEWANGVTYNYQKEPQEVAEDEEPIEVSNIPYVVPSIIDDIDIQNYRKNIIKNVETEEYAYYTIKMTYVASKPRKARMMSARSASPSLIFNSTTIENVNFNGVELDKVVFNGTTVFEKKSASFADIILANSLVNEGTPDFSLTATTDEGIFATDDPIYGENAKSYYFRGAVINNYVKFANFWWRIVKINGDGTIRLIYDGTEAHSNGTNTTDSIVPKIAYNKNYNASYYVGWTYTENKQRPEEGDTSIDSNAKTQTESWYNSNIGNNSNYAEKVADGKFINDRNVKNGNTWAAIWSTFYYAAYERIWEIYQPTLSCNTEDIYTLKVGAITADEIMFAGGTNVSNTSFYLCNQQRYWTMTPYYYEYTSASNRYAALFYMHYDSRVSFNEPSFTFGIRPVINLKADVQVTGTGTMEDPYVVVGAE